MKRTPPTAIELALIAAPLLAGHQHPTHEAYTLAIKQAWILWEEAVRATYQCDEVEVLP